MKQHNLKLSMQIDIEMYTNMRKEDRKFHEKSCHSKPFDSEKLYDVPWVACNASAKLTGGWYNIPHDEDDDAGGDDGEKLILENRLSA